LPKVDESCCRFRRSNMDMEKTELDGMRSPDAVPGADENDPLAAAAAAAGDDATLLRPHDPEN
jgi:hypothetical protein